MKSDTIDIRIVVILVTCRYLIGRSKGDSLCDDGVALSPANQATLPCVKDTTCNITGPADWVPTCEIAYGKECRYGVGQGQTMSSRDVTDIDQSSFATLSRLGVRPLGVIYSFYAEIEIAVQDVKDQLISGIKLEFQSINNDVINDNSINNDDCLPSTIPVCRYFKLSQGNSNPSSLHGPAYETGGISPQSKERLDKVDQGKVFIYHSCFGLDVQPGSFLIRLTPFPGSKRSLEYLVAYHYNYSESKNRPQWPYMVVGVAKNPEANEIHVVVQGPDSKRGEDSNYLIHLELRRTTRRQDSVQTIQLNPHESSAVFQRVPRGLYWVMVTFKEHQCQLLRKCPSFRSANIYIDSNQQQDGTENSSVENTRRSTKKTTMMIMIMTMTMTIIGSLAVLCLLAIVVSRVWKRRSRVKQLPSILVVGLGRGHLKDRTVTYFTDAIEELLTTAFKDDADDKTNNGRHVIVKSDHNDFLNKSTQNSPSSDSHYPLDANIIRRKIKPHRVVIFVKFTPEVAEKQSESVYTVTIRSDIDNVTDIMSASSKRHNRYYRDKICVVCFTESSTHAPLSDGLARLRHSTNSESTVDSSTTVTCLIPDGDMAGKMKGDDKYKKKTPSTSNTRRAKLDEIINIKNSSLFPHTFNLPSEAGAFFQWIYSRTRGTNIPSHDDNTSPQQLSLHTINACEKWQAALTCSRKAFIDRDNNCISSSYDQHQASCIHSNDDECLTIITEEARNTPNEQTVVVMIGDSYSQSFNKNSSFKDDDLGSGTNASVDKNLGSATDLLFDGLSILKDDGDCRTIVTENCSDDGSCS